MFRIELLVDARNDLGEGPLWDVDEQRLYWIDSHGKAVHRCDARGHDVRSWSVPEHIGSMCLRGWLKKRLGPEPRVGVWLPSSVGSALANIALAYLRRTSVNLNYTAGPDAVRSAIERYTGQRLPPEATATVPAEPKGN